MLPNIMLDVHKLMRGSITKDPIPCRLAFIMMVVLAGDIKSRTGELRFEDGEPMDIDYIADQIRIPTDDVKKAIEIGMQDLNEYNGQPRITVKDINGKNCYVITNFQRMQHIKDPSDNITMTPEQRKMKGKVATSHMSTANPEVAATVPSVKKLVLLQLEKHQHPNEAIVYCINCKNVEWMPIEEVNMMEVEVKTNDEYIPIKKCYMCGKEKL